MRVRHRVAAIAASTVLLAAGCTPGAAPDPGPGSNGAAPTAPATPGPTPDPGPVRPDRPVTASGPSPFAGCDAGRANAQSRVFEGAEVEPSVAMSPADPSVIVGAWQQDRWSDGGARGVVVAASADGGRTWTRNELAVSACATEASDLARVSDPWVSFGPDGRAYLVVLAVGDGVRIATSTDGGMTWPDVVRIPVGTGRTFADKTAVTAHPTRPGVAYAVWNENQPGEPSPRVSVLAITTDGGATWGQPRVILGGDPDGGGPVGDQILVDPRDDTLYHLYDWGPVRRGRLDSANVGLQVSTDGGTTWSASRLVHEIELVEGGSKTPDGRRIRSGAGVVDAAVDPLTGAVHVVWEDARFSDGETGEIAWSRSTDRGAIWSDPVRLSDPGAAPAFTPMVDTDGTGRLVVTHYAVRDGAAAPLTDVWALVSTDGGRTFDRTRLDGPFDLSRAPVAGGLFLGDYTGLSGGGDDLVALYAVTSATASGPTEIRASFIP